MPSPVRFTRRRLLAGAAAGAAGLATFELVDRPFSAGSSRQQAKVHAFRSRPDLRPPVVTVTHDVAGGGEGAFFAAPYPNPAQGGPMIFDARGDLIWFRDLGQQKAANFRVQEYQGRPALTWWQGNINSVGQGFGNYVIADETYGQTAEVRAGGGLQGDLHEFLLTPQGTALISAVEVIDADLRALGGSRTGKLADSVLQEIDVASGRVLFQWRASAHVAQSESYSPAGGPQFDYFHLNSIDVDSDGNLLISARNTHALYKLDRRTGAVIWRLGGRRSDFAMGPGTTFAWQHDARRQADGSITLFDDGASPAVEKQSRALVLSVDEARRTVALRRQYVHPGGNLLAGSQGNVQVLATGNVFVGWGAEPYFTEFTPGGGVAFDAHMPAPAQSYRSFRYPWGGLPAEPPALAAQRTRGGAQLFASWNGATGVSHWLVLGGTGPAALRPLARARRSGFETAIALPSTLTHYSVRALDPSGTALADSPVQAV